MKIAIDISNLNKSNLSKHQVRGSGKYLEELVGNLVENDKDNYYEVIEKPKSNISSFDLIHYPYFEPFFLSLPYRTIKPSIVTVHDLIPLVFPDKFPVGIKGNIKWKIQKSALKKKDLIVTDSEASKVDISKIAGIDSDRIKVVYLAASKIFRKKAKNFEILRKYKLPENFMLYVGDATWNKNLIRVAESVKKSGENIVMVGKALVSNDYDRNNPWNKELVNFQNLIKSDDRFFLPGFVDSEDLNDLYNLAQALLMPSLYEGFGLPVLEAMQSGCPVITSDKGSLGEVCGEGVYYVDPYSVESIIKGIREVTSNDEKKAELSEKGLKQANKFTWNKFTSDMKKVYENVSK